MKHSVACFGSLVVLLAGCAERNPWVPDFGPSTFDVRIVGVNGADPPTADNPLPPNHGDTTESWDFQVEAKTAAGDPASFDGYVRIAVHPGAVLDVTGVGAWGRNLLLVNGKGSGTAALTAMYGPSRLWVEDLGYFPAPQVTEFNAPKPLCSDGLDNDLDGAVDFPSDPGCAYADDETEVGGTFADGVSPPVHYALPKVSDVRGTGAATPYPFEQVEVNTAAPQRVVVTRVASDGFYVTDIDPTEVANGYNSLFAFSFSTPAGMRVCDVLTYLSGTSNDFFGFTELNFPSYRVSFPIEGQAECEVPEPVLLDAATINDAAAMQKQQSALARIQDYQIAKYFGPELMTGNLPGDNRSNCDFDGNGQIDYTTVEGDCANVCDKMPECSEWTGYSARAAYKVYKKNPNSMIKVSTATVAGFDPTAYRGQVIGWITGTLRKFSGGSLNWTLEARCPDDLVCSYPGCGATTPVSSKTACVRLRTSDDNDEGTN